MATSQRDYYDVLGVSRTAGDAEIKKAFRRLARELHPDVSDASDAEERFKEVVEAYEVLSSSERRELYDRYGREGLRSRGFEPTFDFGSLSDLFSAFFGDDLFGVEGRRTRRGADLAAEVAIDLVEAPCRACGGGGRVLTERELDVEIPPGIHDGQRIRISGEGHAGALGGRSGDVYVRVRVRPDPRFVREGNDVFSTVDLTMTEAALGTKRTIPTLDGELEVELAPGTQPGHVVLLRGAGMPVLQGYGRGDHRVLVNVAVPRNLSEAQRRLLEQFADSEDESTYRAVDGFFDKLKSHFR